MGLGASASRCGTLEGVAWVRRQRQWIVSVSLLFTVVIRSGAPAAHDVSNVRMIHKLSSQAVVGW